MKIVHNAANYVTAAHPINHVLLASETNLYQRNVFSQIADAPSDFMITIQHNMIVRVIIITKIHFLNILFI